MLLRLGIVIVALAGCRNEGRSPDRHPAVAAPPVGSADSAARSPAVPAPGVAPAAVVAEPPGTDRLVPVPADVAARVELREVVRGLSRPVLVTIAPGDPRKRLFVVEQHVGRI